MSKTPFSVRFLIAVFLGTLVGLGSNAYAERVPPHWFLGSDLGYGSVSPYAAPEGARDGIQFDLQALGSAYYRNFVFDLGLGWEYGKRTGTNSNGYTKTFNRGGMIEAAVRYGKPTGWQFGPVFDAYLTSDVGLTPSTNLTGAPQSPLLLGVQALYEIPRGDYRIRFGGKWLHDININNRTVSIIQGTVEIGWPFGSPGKIDTSPRAPERLAGYQIITKDRATQRVKLMLDARRIEFDTDKASIRPEALARLSRLGRFLAKNLSRWDHLQISGHTDERGSVDYNQKLSETRAAAVLTALHGAGVPRARMDSRGFSKLQPIEQGHNEFAWQRNRRVEFEFTGVSDIDLIVDGVNDATGEE